MNKISLNRVSSFFALLSVIMFVIVIDTFTKWFSRLHGVGVCNEGISFGISWISEPMIIAVSAFLIVAVIIYLLSIKIGSSVETDIVCVGLALMIAGGLSNLISRLQWGCVWDWISLGIGTIHFNIADVAIDVGIVLFTLGVVVIMYKDRYSERK